MYFAKTMLNSSEDEFWNMSPITYNNLLDIHVEMEKAKNGR
jgi:hypothetical protein